jgi:hypothetical protein
MSISSYAGARIRVLRATENPEFCASYLSQQKKAFGDFGCESLVPANPPWVSDLNTFLLLASDPGMEALVGGIRLHLRAPLNQIPVEAIFDELQPSVSRKIKTLSQSGSIAEPSGLWVDRRFRGARMGEILLAVGVALSIRLNASIGVCFASPHTAPIFEALGFRIDESVGQRGRFEYPDPRYLSQLMWNKPLSTRSISRERAEVVNQLLEVFLSFRDPGKIEVSLGDFSMAEMVASS